MVRQSRVEFSALATNFWASSFFSAAARPGGAAAITFSSAARSASARAFASWRARSDAGTRLPGVRCSRASG